MTERDDDGIEGDPRVPDQDFDEIEENSGLYDELDSEFGLEFDDYDEAASDDPAVADARRDYYSDVETVSLSHAQVTAIASDVFDHINLLNLDLFNNWLSQVPPEIGQLAKLDFLDLGGNSLTSLPPEIGRLKELTSLNLSDNRFEGFPKAVCELRSLTYLNLNDNKLAELPSEIGQLQNLVELHITGNRIRELPKEIGQLRNLRELHLSDNPLSSLPSQIRLLSNLTALYIDVTELAVIPPEIGDLGSLEVLTCEDSEITSVPRQIGQLSQLRELLIGNCGLSELPAEIGQLTSLERLDLSGNDLTVLPRELANLSKDLVLELSANPLEEPLPSLVARGLQDLFTYLRSLDQGEPQYEAKMLLVGEGNVGKTSLVAALLSKPFIADRPTTHGIELGTLTVQHPGLAVDMTINTWDFGGQEVYRITHQFFFSRRSLYLLVWRPREGQEENAIEAWCRRIRLRVGEDARIIIVATHSEERRAELDYPYLRDKFGDMLAGHYAVDNRSGKGIAELRQAIAKEAANLPQMGEMVNSRWIKARNDVLRRRKPQMSFVDFSSIGKTYNLTEAEIATLAKLLHDLGHVIHYGEDDGLKDIVVLQPEWLTKAIGYVLEDEETRVSGGILGHQHLKKIWTGGKGRRAYPTRYHPYFLRLMEKFDVSYRLPDEDASLIGQLVPYERPPLLWDDPGGHSPNVRMLSAVCRVQDEAPGLIAWLTVRNHRFSTGQHWRRGVFLEHRQYGSQALLELREDKRQLSLIVRAPSPDFFFSILRDSVEDLIRRRWPGLAYDLFVPCQQMLANGAACQGQIAFSVLQKFRERRIPQIVCYECAEPQDVARLLTGFEASDAPLHQVLDAIEEQRKSIGGRLDRIEAHAADSASQIRIVLKALSAEIIDCPRLFTLIPTDPRKLKRVKFWQDTSHLALWCEHIGSEHSWPDANYRVEYSREWFQRIAPYAVLMAKTLRLAVPVVGAAVGMVLPEQELKALQHEIELMKALVDKLPAGGGAGAGARESQVSSSEGAGLRALRSLLLELDPSRYFGGLRRVLTSSGDFLWVCPRHYSDYDPGLPSLPD